MTSTIHTHTLATICLASLSLLLCLPPTSARSPTDPPVEHVVYVDGANNNFLFRGGGPWFDNGTVDHEGWVISLQMAAANAGVTLPANPYILDMNLLNWRKAYDVEHTIQEYTFFKQNPKLGEFHFWETYGTDDNATEGAWARSPPDYKAFMLESMPTWNADNLIHRVEQLKYIMEQGFVPSDPNTTLFDSLHWRMNKHIHRTLSGNQKRQHWDDRRAVRHRGHMGEAGALQAPHEARDPGMSRHRLGQHGERGVLPPHPHPHMDDHDKPRWPHHAPPASPQRGGVIVYGHCSCGCDRTGEMFGSYAMRFLNYTWEQVNIWNTKIKGDLIGCEHYRSLQWYCLYLNHKFNRHLDCLTNYPCDPDS